MPPEKTQEQTQQESATGNPGAAMFAVDRASQRLGVELVEVEPGRAVTRLTVTAEMLNGHGVAHGGYVFSVADSAFGCACNSHGPVALAAAADIVYLRPAREGDVLLAEAVERAVAGRTGLYDVTVRSGSEVVAEFRGNGRFVRQPKR